MEMTENGNPAGGYLIAQENKIATTMKQKAYGTLVFLFLAMQAETVDQLVSLPQKAEVIRHFEEKMRSATKIPALIAIPYFRSEL